MMTLEQLEERFLDYLESRLAPEELREFEDALARNPAARQSLAEYREILQMEELCVSQTAPATVDLGEKVMSRISSPPPRGEQVLAVWRFIMETLVPKRLVAGSAALAAVIALGFALSLQIDFATVEQLSRPESELASLEAGSSAVSGPRVAEPLTLPSTGSSDSLPTHSQATAAQNRAVVVENKQLSGLEGYSRPGTNVDVVVTYKDHDGRMKSSVISQDAKVLSAGSDKEGLTLSAKPEDAFRIEAAKKLGEVSVVTRGSDALSARSVRPQGATVVQPAPAAALEKSRDLNAPSQLKAPAAPPSREEVLRRGKGFTGSVESAIGAYKPNAGHSFQRLPYGSRERVAAATNSRSYNNYEENKRIAVASEPMSTFSIDVDTASYSQARRALQEGRLPAPDSVRIEEFLNYFSYSYPVQSSLPFTLSYEAAPSPLEPQKYLLKLGIKAKETAPYEGGWNLVFLVDVSGSMDSEDKLELVKKSLRILVDTMRPEDRVAIVTYAGSSGVALQSTPGSEKHLIHSVISSLGAGGSTNGSGGITEAYRIALQNYRRGAVNRVILATDGDFNVGVTSQSELISLIEEKRNSGITLTTIGVGQDNLKDGTLEQLANKGNGNYFYLDSIKEARKVMSDDLTKNMEVIAKDVKLQIEFNPQHVASYRLIGYDNRRLENHDFANDAIDAGEIGAGHTVTALYELVLAGSPAAGTDELSYRYHEGVPPPAASVKPQKHGSELAFLKIRYKDPEGTTSKLLEYPLAAESIKTTADTSSADFRFAAAVSYFGHVLRQSQFRGQYSLEAIAKLATDARGEDHDGARQEFIELVKNAQVLDR